MKISKDRPLGIVAKSADTRAQGVVTDLVKWLTERDLPYAVDTQTASVLKDINGSAGSPISASMKREEMTASCSLVISLGGDGTLLSVARFPTKNPPPIIGVNLGRLGFLTETTVEKLYETLEATLKGEAQLERRALLTTRVQRAGKVLAEYFALNDVVVSKEALARIFGMDIKVNGEQAAYLRGDGLIVSTPAGSTAYSLASGGSIVHPGVEALLLTPICSHSLTSRPLIVPSTSDVELTIHYSSGKEDQVYLTIDGQEGMPLINEDKILVTTAAENVTLALPKDRSYFKHLAEKLSWGGEHSKKYSGR